MFISIVVPVFNDEEVLPELLRRVSPVAQKIAESDYEIILVDDGSRDRSWNVIQELKASYQNVVAVKLARNFGQQNSIAAGLSVAQGDYIVLMDSDLQDRPEDIPVLLDALKGSNASMAIAQWISRKDTEFS